MEHYGYIYLTENLVNGKKYIGKHCWKKNYLDPSYYGSGKLLLRAIDKYGKENFKVHILEWCKTEWQLNVREMAWIRLYDAVHSPEFYNIAEGGPNTCFHGKNHPFYGKRSPMYGKKASLETRRKMSEHHADVSGENCYFHKLTTLQVLKIVELHNKGLSNKELSDLFQVDRTCICRICNGKRWSTITGIKPK